MCHVAHCEWRGAAWEGVPPRDVGTGGGVPPAGHAESRLRMASDALYHGAGTCEFDPVQGRAENRTVDRASDVVAAGQLNVLVVDDEANIRKVLVACVE